MTMLPGVKQEQPVPDPPSEEPNLSVGAPPSLTSLIVERLTAAILGQELKPGERLVEAGLAKRLGVSRIPLREALRQLHALGLVEMRAGRGSYVSAPSLGDFERMIPVRAALEGLAARLVALRGSVEALAEIETANEAIHRTAEAGDVSGCRDAGWRFHADLVRLADNRFLFESWQPLSLRVRLFMHHSQAYLSNLQTVLEIHDEIVARLRSGDPDASESYVRDMILLHGFGMVGKALPDGLAPPGGPLRPVSEAGMAGSAIGAAS